MINKFPEMKGHVVVVGYGVVGEKVVNILVEHGMQFVVVDSDVKKVERVHELGHGAVHGDATLSRVLREAGIENAKAIAIALDNDAKNLFCVLTARDLNKDVFIATRANDDFVREKLIEAGADYIVMPHKVASREIVREFFKVQ